MSQRRPRPHNTNTVWACSECKRRKGKCSGDSPCHFCSRTNRRCVYEARPVRLPLTRVNLDHLQARCAMLERVLRVLDPTIDIEARISEGVSPISGFTSALKSVEANSESGLEDEDEEETIPESACDFEWYEGPRTDITDDITSLADGMAFLNVDSRDVGYLGTSSGAALLRTIQGLLSRHHHHGPLLPPGASTPPSPNVRLSEELMASVASSCLLDSYFELYHPSYPVVHEQTFRLKCAELSKDLSNRSHWKMLYYMVLTMGAFCSYSGSSDEHRDLDLQLWSIIRKDLSMTSILESGTLERVQTLALMGQFLQKRDRPNTGYNIMGAAVRMALGLGLHRDFTDRTNTLGRETRRRTWWVIFCFDVGSSITFGRPTVVSDRVETRTPMNINDSGLRSPTSLLPLPTAECTPYSAIIAHCELVRLVNRIHNRFFASQGHQPPRDVVHALDSQLMKWEKSLPPYFALPSAEVPSWFIEPRSIVLWKGLNFRMLMHKRFLPALKKPRFKDGGGTGTTRDAKLCLALAIDTIHSVHDFINSRTLRRGAAWYCTYYVFQAALVVAIAILITAGPPEPMWAESILVAEDCLEAATGSLGGGARRYLDVLRKVSRMWRDGGGAPPLLPSAGGRAGGMVSDNALSMMGWGGEMGFEGLGIPPAEAGAIGTGLGLGHDWMPAAHGGLGGSGLQFDPFGFGSPNVAP